MITDKAAAAALVRELAAAHWDAALAERGFTRPASSLAYARKVSDGGRQRIHLDLAVRPPYAPNAFHLSLRCSIAFAEMAKIGAEMFGRMAGGFGKSGTVQIEPLDLVDPASKMILFTSAAEAGALAPVVLRYLTGALVPHLDERTSLSALTEANRRSLAASGMEPGDVGRLPVVIAAGQLAMGDPGGALRTLESAYPAGSPGRDLYREAFAVAGRMTS